MFKLTLAALLKMLVVGSFQVAQLAAEAGIAKGLKGWVVDLDLFDIHVCDEAVFDKVFD